MKVLFLRSGNNGIDPISTSQGESLKEIGIEVEFFDITGKGFIGYISNIRKLRRTVKENGIELIHAHYSLSGFLAFAAMTRKPIVTSLMGSDVLRVKRPVLVLTRYFAKHFWADTIVKSKTLKDKLVVSSLKIIPNGVNLNQFPIILRDDASRKLGWSVNKKHILFSSDPERPEKNYLLANKAFDEIKRMTPSMKFEVHCLKNIHGADMYKYYCGADVLVMTSKYEGSPNVIKEAMACNCPIVSTDVGDVKEVIFGTNGCCIASCEPNDIANKILAALSLKKRTNGRDNIKSLERGVIARKISEIYKNVLAVN